MFIELTYRSGRKVFQNINNIVLYEPVTNGSYVSVGAISSYQVKETPEEIQKKIYDAIEHAAFHFRKPIFGYKSSCKK